MKRSNSRNSKRLDLIVYERRGKRKEIIVLEEVVIKRVI